MYIRDKNGNYVPVPTIAGGDGREVELRATKDYIQWRYEDLDWQNLIAVKDLIGPKGNPGDNGEEVELRTHDGNIEWRLGDGGWQLLFTMDVYATISIGNVVTGAPGTDVSVTNSGTSTEAVLNFTIPRGESAVYTGTTEPEDPNVQLWIYPEADGYPSYPPINGLTVTIAADAWNDNQVIVDVNGITEDNIVITSPRPDDVSAWNASGICCNYQGENQIGFKCDIPPLDSISVNILVIG